MFKRFGFCLHFNAILSFTRSAHAWSLTPNAVQCSELIGHVEHFLSACSDLRNACARTLHVLLRHSHLLTLDLALPPLLRFYTFPRNSRHCVRVICQTDGLDLPEPYLLMSVAFCLVVQTIRRTLSFTFWLDLQGAGYQLMT